MGQRKRNGDLKRRGSKRRRRGPGSKRLDYFPDQKRPDTKQAKSMMDSWFGVSFEMGHKEAREMYSDPNHVADWHRDAIKSTVDFISKSDSTVVMEAPIASCPVWSVTVNATFNGISHQDIFESVDLRDVVNGAIGWANQKRVS